MEIIIKESDGPNEFEQAMQAWAKEQGIVDKPMGEKMEAYVHHLNSQEGSDEQMD